MDLELLGIVAVAVCGILALFSERANARYKSWIQAALCIFIILAAGGSYTAWDNGNKREDTLAARNELLKQTYEEALKSGKIIHDVDSASQRILSTLSIVQDTLIGAAQTQLGIAKFPVPPFFHVRLDLEAPVSDAGKNFFLTFMPAGDLVDTMFVSDYMHDLGRNEDDVQVTASLGNDYSKPLTYSTFYKGGSATNKNPNDDQNQIYYLPKKGIVTFTLLLKLPIDINDGNYKSLNEFGEMNVLITIKSALINIDRRAKAGVYFSYRFVAGAHIIDVPYNTAKNGFLIKNAKF